MTALAAVAFAITAALDWWAVSQQRPRVEMVAKPLVMASLGWLAWTMGAADQDVGRLLLVALGFSLVGDIFLLGRTTVDFSGGLASYFVAHIAFALAFFALGFQPRWALLGLLIAVPMALTSGRRIVRGAAREGGAVLGAGATAYLVVVVALMVAASGTALPLVILGAVFLLFSDTVLAIDRFVGPRAHARMLVIVTYHLAQVLMVVGVLR